jgi:hypothetical protein
VTLFEDGLTWRQLGAAITAALGVLALVRPHAAASFTSVRPSGPVGVSELRATYGGFFLALGAFALFAGSGPVYRALGLAWAAAAGARLLSVFVDGSRSGRNLGGIAFEGLIAALLLVF